MNTEQTFWYAIWRLVAIALCITVLTMGGCVANNNRLISNMVEKGASPQDAMCAINGPTSISAAICGVLASKVTK